MSAGRKTKKPTELPGCWLAVVAVPLLACGAFIAGTGAWSLLHGGAQPNGTPGWPFAIFGSLFLCVGWAMLLHRRPVVALMPVLLLCVLSVGAGGYMAWRQHRRMATYQPVDAWVLAAAVQQRVVEHEEGREVTYTPAAVYRYEVGGRAFSSDTVYPMPCWFVDPLESRGTARQVLKMIAPGLPEGFDRIGQLTAEADRAKGYPVKAYCNPRDPADSFLIKRYSWLPFLMILGPAALLLIAGLVGVTRSSLPERRKRAGRWVGVAAWHAAGLLVAGHCLAIVLGGSGALGRMPAVIVLVHEVIGLVPLAIALPQHGWPGRLKEAIGLGGIVGAVVAVLALPIAVIGGTAAGYGAQLVFGKSLDIAVWAALGAGAMAGAAAVVAFVAHLVTGDVYKRR